MKKRIGIAVGVLLVGLCCIGLYRMHLTRKAGFVLEEHLEDTLLWLGEEQVPLREALYYIMLVEDASSETAKNYSEEVQKSFWNIKTGEEGYISQVAKQVILEQMIKDEILYREAVKNDWEIDASRAESAADQLWEEMTPYQRELTGYTRESLKERMQKVYAGQVYGEVYGEDYAEIKEEYQVSVDEKLWEALPMGRITLEN